MTIASQQGQYLERSASGGLAEVVSLILDKGLVIDVYLRVSLVGIEVLTIDSRIVVASVDTYLRFAEAANRLDLSRTETQGVPGMMKELREGGAQSKTKGVLEGAKEVLQDALQGGARGRDTRGYEEEARQERPRRRARREEGE
jgi:hypothetical protein